MNFLSACLKIILYSSALLAVGCATGEKHGTLVGSHLDKNHYDEMINKNTRHDLQYEGFYNKFEIFATFINSETQSAILQKKSDVYQWDAKQAQTEREKMFQENSTLTHFAVSFYTPSVRLNDLHKAASIWKIYLEYNGQRYEGHAMKRNGKLEDIQEIFPYHNRWSVPYEITFNVPLSVVEKNPVKFIITSTQGTSKLKF